MRKMSIRKFTRPSVWLNMTRRLQKHHAILEAAPSRTVEMCSRLIQLMASFPCPRAEDDTAIILAVDIVYDGEYLHAMVLPAREVVLLNDRTDYKGKLHMTSFTQPR